MGARARRALVAFNEVRVLLDRPDTATRIAEYSGAGRVPVLLAGEMTIWDSLAICEYLAEQFPDLPLWPRDVAARAMARSVTAEMHSGFAGLRSAMSMNIRVAPETLALMRKMVAQGEVDALVPERVWQEAARGLMEAKPSRMLAVLRDCGVPARCCRKRSRSSSPPSATR